MRKKSGAGGIRPCDVRLYYKATVITTAWYWHKHRNIDPCNWTESSEINLGTCGHRIYNKGGKNLQRRKDSLFNKWCCQNRMASCKRMKLGHFLPPYAKINSKWTKDLDVRLETIKIIKEKRGKMLSDINSRNIFLDLPPRARNKIKNTWDLMKFKSLCPTNY